MLRRDETISFLQRSLVMWREDRGGVLCIDPVYKRKQASLGIKIEESRFCRTLDLITPCLTRASSAVVEPGQRLPNVFLTSYNACSFSSIPDQLQLKHPNPQTRAYSPSKLSMSSFPAPSFSLSTPNSLNRSQISSFLPTSSLSTSNPSNVRRSLQLATRSIS